MKHGFSVVVQKTQKGWKPAKEKGKNQKKHTNVQKSILEVPPTSHTDTVIWSTLSLKLLTITEALRQLTVWPYLTIYDNNWQYDNFPNAYEQEDFLLLLTRVFLMDVDFFSPQRKAVRLLPIIVWQYLFLFTWMSLQYHQKHWNTENHKVINNALEASSTNQYKNCMKSRSGFISIHTGYL